MPVCTYCKKEFVWKKAKNGEWRPHEVEIGREHIMHNCQAFWADDGHKMTDKELADHYQDYLDGQKEMEKQAMENDRCPACDGGGCSECEGSGDYEGNDPDVDIVADEQDTVDYALKKGE